MKIIKMRLIAAAIGATAIAMAACANTASAADFNDPYVDDGGNEVAIDALGIIVNGIFLHASRHHHRDSHRYSYPDQYRGRNGFDDRNQDDERYQTYDQQDQGYDQQGPAYNTPPLRCTVQTVRDEWGRPVYKSVCY